MMSGKEMQENENDIFLLYGKMEAKRNSATPVFLQVFGIEQIEHWFQWNGFRRPVTLKILVTHSVERTGMSNTC